MYDQLKTNLLETPKLKFRESFSKAWTTFGANSANSIGYFIVATLIAIFGSMIVGLIPILGALAILIAGYPAIYSLFNGYYVIARKTEQNQPRSFNDYFGGFKAFPKLIILNLILFAIIMPLAGIFLYSIGYFELIASMLDGQTPDPYIMQEWAAKLTSMDPIAITTVILFYSAIFLTAFVYLMSMPFIVDNDITPIEAIKLSFTLIKNNIFKSIAVLITCYLMMVIGTLLLLVGLFVAIPVIYFFLFHLYNSTARPNHVSLEESIEKFGIQELDINTEAQEANS